MNNDFMVIYLLSTVVWVGLVLILVLVGRADKNRILSTFKEMNSNQTLLDAWEKAFLQAQEPVKMMIGVMGAAVDMLGKSLPADSFVGNLAKQLDQLLDTTTDGLPNVVPAEETITVITPPSEPKPDIEPDGEPGRMTN